MHATGKENGWTNLPCTIDAAGLRLIQPGDCIVGVETHYECRDAKRPNASRLRVALLRQNAIELVTKLSPRSQRAHLLNSRDMSCDILDSDWVLYRKAMALALHPCLVDEHASIGGETYEEESITSCFASVHQPRPSPD